MPKEISRHNQIFIIWNIFQSNLFASTSDIDDAQSQARIMVHLHIGEMKKPPMDHLTSHTAKGGVTQNYHNLPVALLFYLEETLIFSFQSPTEFSGRWNLGLLHSAANVTNTCKQNGSEYDGRSLLNGKSQLHYGLKIGMPRPPPPARSPQLLKSSNLLAE